MASNPLRLFAAGAAHIDRRGRPSGAFRPGASNPGTVAESVGGAILNAALTLRPFGPEVTLVSARGGDSDGAAVAKALREAGIADLGVTWLDRHTASYTAILDDRGELVAGIADTQIYDLMTARIFSRRHVRDVIAAADALLLDANLPLSGIDYLLDAFEKRPTAAIGVSPAKAVRLGPRLADFSLVFLSRAEAACIVEASASTGIAVLARLLSESGARRAAITDGSSDVAILDDGEILLQAPPPVTRLRDVTGAGDTLAAVATFAFAGGTSLTDAVRLGMAAASRRIGSEGADAEGAEVIIRTIAAEMAPPRPVDAE